MTSRLLDTDVCIDALRSRDSAVAARLQALGEIAVSSITVAELSYGAAHSSAPDRNRDEVTSFLRAVSVLDFDERAAWRSGVVRRDLASSGTPIGGYDVLIAGHALAGNHVLVTGNVGEFARVTGLRIEAWRA